MRLICSPCISQEDEVALTEGYSARNSDVIAASLRNEVEAMFSDKALSAPYRLLAYLVSEGIIDVQIAIPGKYSDAEIKRLFHDKVGLFSDKAGNIVGFRGSMNETFKGLSSDGNIESIDVFLSWDDERDRTRVTQATSYFDRLWHNQVKGVIVYPFPEAVRNTLKQHASGADWHTLLDEIQVIENRSLQWKPCKKTGGNTPRPHQTAALDAWIANERRGIFEHATGSGKTFTAICAIRHALDMGDVVLILVPSRDLLRQWQSELQKTLSDIPIQYLFCGDGNTEWKRPGVLRSWTSPTSGQHKIILATMDTACQPSFIQNVKQGNYLFVVADEVHRLGSTKRRQILQLDTGARLGLSATPRRYGDPEGTRVLFDYFADIISPPFTLEDAINKEVLTRYFYYPQTLSLSANEQEEWNQITGEIQKLIARTSTNDEGGTLFANNPRLKQLCINRARIVKNAGGKIPLATHILTENFKAGQKWIVYCDNRVQLKAVLDNAMQAGLDAYEYYSDMAGDRETTLKYFELNGGVLVSIKCLDEGVDIPSTTHALILASSQNPREFIQRRGRILRKSKDKHFAKLYDAIALPVVAGEENDRSLSIIVAELSRAIQFGKSAENPACVTDLKNIAIEFQIDFQNLADGGIEDDDE